MKEGKNEIREFTSDKPAIDFAAWRKAQMPAERQLRRQVSSSAASSSRRHRLSRRERRRLKKRERRRRQIRQAGSFCKKFLAFTFSHIGLSCLIVAYIVAGGLAFQAIELPFELRLREQIRQFKNGTLTTFLSRQKRLLCPDELATEMRGNTSSECFLSKSQLAQLSRLANETLAQVVTNITKYVKEDGWNGSLQEHEYTWNLPGALLFVVTIITTIGYGHAVPKTLEGMMGTLACAFLGIPLMFLYLNNIGDYLADGFRYVYSNTCRPRLKRMRLCDRHGNEEGNDSEATLRRSRHREAFDIVRVKTDFARPLSRTASESAAHAKETVRTEASGTRRDLLVEATPVEFDPAAADSNSPDTTRVRRGIATARILPATVARPPIRPPLVRSRSVPETPMTIALVRASSSNCAAPLVDWTVIDWDLSRPTGVGTIDEIELESEPLPRRISYISLPSPERRSSEDSSSSSTVSLASINPSDVVGSLDIEALAVGNDLADSISPSVAATAAVAAGAMIVPGDLATGGLNQRRVQRLVELRRRLDRLQRLSVSRRLRKVTVPLSLSVALMVGYVVLGSFLFTIWEKRDYVKWSYFCFITLSTIGFGDIVPEFRAC